MSAVDIFLEHMAVIVFIEKRTFSYKDFLSFEYNSKEYKFEHGTIRNIFSKLKQEGKIERVYRSGPTFNTLKGCKFGKSITVNHTEGSAADYAHLSPKQRTFLQCLRVIPTDRPAIHDIRLSFTFKHLWPILSDSTSPLIKSRFGE